MKPNVCVPAGQTLTDGFLARSLNLLLPAASNMAAGTTARTWSQKNILISFPMSFGARVQGESQGGGATVSVSCPLTRLSNQEQSSSASH